MSDDIWNDYHEHCRKIRNAQEKDSLLLAKRTAWMNVQREEHPEQERDRKDLNTAMYMLAYLGAVNMALYDLQQELTDAGLYRHALKAQVNRIIRIIGQANGNASDILKAINNGKRVRQYVDMYEYAYNEVQEHILLEAPERAYNIVRALSRLLNKGYEDIGRRTAFAYLREAVEVLKRLDIPQIPDRNIDSIIERVVQIRLQKA